MHAHRHTPVGRGFKEGGMELPAQNHTGGPSDCEVHTLPVLPLEGT